MEAKYADTPEKLEKAAETLAKCSTIDTSGLEKCDKAVAYVKCAKDVSISK
ncbi:hypothetical protein J6590_046297 [Homalodisca vitripennis]|nr:hypothetical protein J6590_046297 [Homalodisca vitripennis]